ncbi:ABC transporter permease [Lysinibacillus sp. KU-BSD001]
MMDILKTKFLLLKRKPGEFIVITIVICVFAYIMGIGQQAKQPIAVHSALDEKQIEQVLNELGKLSNYEFSVYEEDEAKVLVEEGKVDVAVFLQDDRYDLLVSTDFMNANLFQNELEAIYQNIVQQFAIVNAYPEEMQQEVTTAISQAKVEPSFAIQYNSFGNDQGFEWDAKLHSLFGFALFMVIYTVASGVNHLVMERRNGVWNRLTVASIQKWEVYVANLTYTFLLGYLQIVIVLCIFHFGVGVDFYGGFAQSLIAVIPYLLCVIAIAIFVASIATTPGQFNAVMTVIAIPFAMLGGAYWPLEIVSSKMILALSYISPITYGLEMLKGVTIGASTFTELLQPLSLLLFMTVIFMGIGINVLEKKSS